MQLNKLILLTTLVVFSFCTLTMVSAAPIDLLETEANKVIAGKYPNTNKSSEDGTLFLAYFNENQEGFQFTVSDDKEPGYPDAVAFEYKGKKAFYFQPMDEISGAIMVFAITLKKSGFSI